MNHACLNAGKTRFDKSYRPRQLQAGQIFDVHLSIHDDEVARSLSLRAGPAESRADCSQVRLITCPPCVNQPYESQRKLIELIRSESVHARSTASAVLPAAQRTRSGTTRKAICAEYDQGI